MNSIEQWENTPVKQWIEEDWISRFFGYLGSFQYLRNKGPAESDGLEKKADNIVYIYGPDRNGMPLYKDTLKKELEKDKNRKYVSCDIDFIGIDAVATEQLPHYAKFQEELSKKFEDCVGFNFPCTRLLNKTKSTTIEKATGTLETTLGVVSTILSGANCADVAGWAIQIAGKIKEEFEKNEYTSYMSLKELEVLLQLENDVKKLGSSSMVLQNSDNVFEFFGLDLKINAVMKRDERIICIIDEFEMFEKVITSKTGQKAFLGMMMEVKDIIWVLLSKEKPNELVREIVKKENCWRMKGVNEDRARAYLEEQCPNEPEEWYQSVFVNTRGYLGLIQKCVEEQKNEKRRYKESCSKEDEERRLMKEFYDEEYPELSETEKLQKIENKINKKKKENPERYKEISLDNWFARVWKEKAALEELISREWISKAGADEGGREARLRLSCLCFLTYLSKSRLGTIEQFSWKKGHHLEEVIKIEPGFNGLNSDGRECMRYLEHKTPLCIEYTDFPGHLYLDPVIVRILLVNDNFNTWLNEFRIECLEQIKHYTDSKKEKALRQDVDTEITVAEIQKNDTEIRGSSKNAIGQEMQAAYVDEKVEKHVKVHVEEQGENNHSEGEAQNSAQNLPVNESHVVTHDVDMSYGAEQDMKDIISEKAADEAVTENRVEVYEKGNELTADIMDESGSNKNDKDNKE